MISSHQFRRDWNARSEFCRKIPEKRSIRRPVWLARVVALQKASVCARNAARVEASVAPEARLPETAKIGDKCHCRF